jgi:hypothetical protein
LILLLAHDVVVHLDEANAAFTHFYEGSWWVGAEPRPRQPGEVAVDHGLTTFLDLIGRPAFELVAGDSSRLPVGQLHWRPGPVRTDAYNEPGEWAITYGDEPVTDWQPVDHAPVFVFECPSYRFRDVDFIAGCRDAIAFLQDYAASGFEPLYDVDMPPSEEQAEQYDDEVAECIRQLMGDAVPRHFRLSDLQSHMADPNAPIDQVTFHYPELGAGTPTHVVVTNRAGQTRQLRLY